MSLWYRLVDRDRRLLALLAEHKVLTTRQVAAIEFTSIRRAQDRLRRLYELGVLFTFRQSYANGGTSETRFALGYVGKRLICALRAKTPPAPKVYAESLERLVVWPKLEHHLGVNDFFCDLAAHRNPARHSKYGVSGGTLTQWWPEKRCVEFFWSSSGHEVRLRPDGYGCWEHHGRAVRFFLEHDTGTESLTVVTRKIADYSAFPTDRFGILLFSVHSTKREIALRAALSRAQAGYDPGFVIATAARDHGHVDGPAGPVWAIWDPRDSTAPVRRYRLEELPERGPRVNHRAIGPDEPLSEAAFDPNDRQMMDLIYKATDPRRANDSWGD
nr:replication-relaxation family protein [Kibdelosporangium sp. MJ126-NF4]CEL17460.1 hypothetical protein [Kibdelosporangium sp. MJ126-NF4]CTQ91313.1 hypothetical protein [Kibdelosporangium sp. MJ126-NF4]